MASTDKPNPGRDVNKKPVLVERGHVVPVVPYDQTNPNASGPAYSPVTGDRAENQEWINTPLRCDHGAPHKTTPIYRVSQTGKEKPQNLCGFHYERAKNNGLIDSSRPPIELTNDPEHIKSINLEDYQIKLGQKNRDAAIVFENTGVLRNVRTVGRPATPSSDTQAALDRANTGGGHLPKDHEEILSKAYTALLHSKKENDDVPHYPTYAKKALSLGVHPSHVSKYFDYAVAHHKKLTGESAVPPVSREIKIRKAQLDFASSDSPVESTETLMQSDIPAAVDEQGNSSRSPKPRYD